ncbi:acyltransferase domain-containing protein, partial [Streptomyces triticirhizae]
MMDQRTEEALRRATSTIRELRGELDRLTAERRRAAEPVAVVGAACRLPGGADSPEALWRLLRAGTDAVRPLTDERWRGVDFSAWDDPAFARIPRHAGLLDEIDGFDAAFFGISDGEAAFLDPQQRLALETVWESAERAGWTPEQLTGAPTGVFLGVGHQDYLLAALARGGEIGSRLATGTARSMIANRVSYELGLTGPSLAIDTACSSSLVAVHLACRSLRAGDCDRAVAGGVNLILSPLSTTLTGRALPMAPDGRVKALAADADGMIRGEGCGVVALRRLSDALADGDPIQAVILADGTNQDGRTNGLTAPSPFAQQRLLEDVRKASGLSAEDITLIETHGTGTPLGDPIEYEAIRAVYGSAPESATCWLGSVKANLGHLEFAAGIASLLKTLGAVQHGVVPRQINIDRISPHIDLTGQRFAVPLTEQPWVAAERRRAAVSSFGFGGSNAHLILVHPDALDAGGPALPPPPAAPVDGEAALLLPLSARSAPALRAQLARTSAALAELPAERLPAALATASRRRAHHPHRLAVAAPDRAGLLEELRRAQAELAGEEAEPAWPRRLAFVYSGQAAQWPRMGVALAERDPVVGEELAAWEREIVRAGGPPLLSTLAGSGAAAALADTRFAQLAIVALQSALTRRLLAWGLAPAAVVGHSVGEVAAAVAAGVLDRAEAVAVLRARAEAL